VAVAAGHYYWSTVSDTAPTAIRDVLAPTGVNPGGWEFTLGFWYGMTTNTVGNTTEFMRIADGSDILNDVVLRIKSETAVALVNTLDATQQISLQLQFTGPAYHTVNCPVLVTRMGFIAVCARNVDGNALVDWYHGELPLSGFGRATKFRKLGTTAIGGSGYFAPITAGKRLWIGGTTEHQNSMNISEIVMYGRDIGEHGVRRLYRNSIKPWDDYTLQQTEPRSIVRVLLEDDEVDLTDLEGMDYVRSASVSEEADSEGNSAKISLFRRKGQFEDLSPIHNNVEGNPYEGFIKLNKRVRVERAVVPHLWKTQGWEWETIFQGHIRRWSYGTDTIELDCEDQSFVLRDAQVLENRAYSMYRHPQLMELFMNRMMFDYSLLELSGGVTKPSFFGYPSGTWKRYPRVMVLAVDYNESP
jgi:hypothetical protein